MISMTMIFRTRFELDLRQRAQNSEPEPVVATFRDCDGEDERDAAEAYASAEGEQCCLASAWNHHPFKPLGRNITYQR